MQCVGLWWLWVSLKWLYLSLWWLYNKPVMAEPMMATYKACDGWAFDGLQTPYNFHMFFSLPLLLQRLTGETFGKHSPAQRWLQFHFQQSAVQAALLAAELAKLKSAYPTHLARLSLDQTATEPLGEPACWNSQCVTSQPEIISWIELSS